MQSIYVSYQVSVHLAKGFQRRRLKCEKLTDDRRRTTSDDKCSNCLWQGELIKTNILKHILVISGIEFNGKYLLNASKNLI